MSLFSSSKRRQFEKVAMPFYKSLFQAAYRLTRQREWAEDLLQETMVRAYERFELFKPGTNCKGWLLTILTRCYLNDLDKGRRRPLTTSFDAVGPESRLWDFAAPEDSTNPVSIVMNQVIDHQIEAALDSLTEDFRVAVLLVDVEEISYQEAADALEIPIGTVRSRVFRGRMQIRQALVRELQDTELS